MKRNLHPSSSYLRLVARETMQSHLGRSLNKDEIVHHKDGDLYNWDVSNLEVLTRSEHATLHSYSKNHCNKLPKTKEYRQKISRSLRGHAVSEESRQKMSEAKKAYYKRRRASNVQETIID